MIKKSSHLFSYQKLKELDCFFDEVFAGFYEGLLKREHLSRFFTSEEQIKNLIKKQRKNIYDSFDDTDEDFHKRYLSLADFHIQILGLTFVDYMEAFDFLKDKILNILHREGKLSEYFVPVNDYFEKAKHYSAEECMKKSIKGIMKYLESTKEDSMPLLFLAEHLTRISQVVESGDTNLIKEIISDMCGLDRWLSSLEAEMMIPDVEILEGLKKRHGEIHAICRNIVYYRQNELYFQSYAEFKTLIHNYHRLYKDINEAYVYFMQNKKEMFLDLIKKTKDKYILYFAFIENLSLIISLQGQEFAEFTIMEFKKSMENIFAGKNHVSIFFWGGGGRHYCG